MEDKSNLEIVEKLRNENHGQFLTLCRMHLSFEIDLELENNDPVGPEKVKSRLWNKIQRKTGKCPLPSTSDTTPVLSQSIINQIRKLVSFLEKKENISQEGIFRKTGSLNRQNELKRLIITNNETLDLENYTAHDCASVLKTIIQEMDEPVVSLNYFFAFQQVADLYNLKLDCNLQETRLLNSLQLLMLLIPVENRTLLRLIVQILNKTIEYESLNKMTAESLSTLFTPHLVCPRKLASEALYKVAKTMYSMVTFIIKKGEIVFHIPDKLATDIRAYFVEKNRRKTMSPEQILNESVASETTASTVFTFIDREKTAKAHDTETTDTALAELYAYIVSLPESSRKKKLIHKFNKENGKGTPLQFLNGQRDKHSTGLLAKTLGSSIKKHIFQKAFLSKTPKRGENSSVQTPNKTVRVLFSNTPCSSQQANSVNIMQSVEETHVSSESIDDTSKHDLNLTQKMSIRSISDSHLNKNFDCNFETPSKEKSASVGDLHNSSDMNSDLSSNIFVSDLNNTVFKCSKDDEDHKLVEIFSPSSSITDPVEETHATPVMYSLSNRLSMSPITKSTKRMPKSMQEQIMTPRSRKPITAIESLSSENKSNVFESLLEEPENNALQYTQENYTAFIDRPSEVVSCYNQESISNTFKEYLFNRSVVISEVPSEIPEDDTSFTSHPDDFIDDIKDLSESQMSDTMLYCLDGNDPMINEEAETKKRTVENIIDDHASNEPNSKRLYIGETSL